MVKAGTKSALKWAVALAVVAGLILGIVRYTKSRAPVGPKYTTAAIDRGRIAARVTATGTLSALVTVLVGSQVSGRIEALKVDYNSPVKKGQIIAVIEPQLFQAAVEQARANYSAAKANVEKAKAQQMDADRQYARAKALGAESLASQADIDTAQANALVAKAGVSSAEAGVQQALAALNQAETNLRYTTIYSPIDGVVISRAVDVGQTVAASLQAPTLFTIAQDLTKMQVDTNVAEGDVGKIQPGMKVSFTVDAYPGQKFDGTVRQVRDAAQTVQNVVTYDAVIDVDNSQRMLKPGMTATVTFTPAVREDVLRIPNAALRYKPSFTPQAGAPGGAANPAGSPSAAAGAPRPKPRADQKTVWVLRGITASPVEIQTGLTDGTMTEVLAGDLKEGDQVITDAVSEPKSRSPF